MKTRKLSPSIWIAAAMIFSVNFVAKPVMAENSTSAQSSKTESISRPEDGTFPSFTQVDVNDDHYITKEELKNFPYMLKVFDLIDAGKDGKLEQHEYQNLEMETKR